MHGAHMLLSLPLATLGGEVESPEGTGSGVGIGVISVASIVIGWVGLFALWWFVFREKARGKRRKDPPA